MILTLQSKLVLLGCLVVAMLAGLPASFLKSLVIHHATETLTELGCPLVRLSYVMGMKRVSVGYICWEIL
jgi:hypothetical protein